MRIISWTLADMQISCEVKPEANCPFSYNEKTSIIPTSDVHKMDSGPKPWVTAGDVGGTYQFGHDAGYDVTLNPDVTDTIRWRFEPSGEYTARSAYRIQFEGSTISVTAPLIYLGWLGTWQVSVFGLLQ